MGFVSVGRAPPRAALRRLAEAIDADRILAIARALYQMTESDRVGWFAANLPGAEVQEITCVRSIIVEARLGEASIRPGTWVSPFEGRVRLVWAHPRDLLKRRGPRSLKGTLLVLERAPALGSAFRYLLAFLALEHGAEALAFVGVAPDAFPIKGRPLPIPVVYLERPPDVGEAVLRVDIINYEARMPLVISEVGDGPPRSLVFHYDACFEELLAAVVAVEALRRGLEPQARLRLVLAPGGLAGSAEILTRWHADHILAHGEHELAACFGEGDGAWIPRWLVPLAQEAPSLGLVPGRAPRPFEWLVHGIPVVSLGIRADDKASIRKIIALISLVACERWIRVDLRELLAGLPMHIEDPALVEPRRSRPLLASLWALGGASGQELIMAPHALSMALADRSAQLGWVALSQNYAREVLLQRHPPVWAPALEASRAGEDPKEALRSALRLRTMMIEAALERIREG